MKLMPLSLILVIRSIINSSVLMDLTLVTKKNLGLLCLLVSGTKGPAELLTLRNVYEIPFIYYYT